MSEDREEKPGRKSGRSGLDDVARVAGVSIATVDRVLNERGSVAAATARRVIEAARQLGLRRTLPTPYTRRIRLEVLLARSQTPFIARLTRAFIQVAATLDRSVIIQRTFFEELKSRIAAQHIRESRADGLILYAEEHPAVLEAIATVSRTGVPVICLVTDLPTSPRLAYVGIDHAKAGRTAAFFAAGMTGRSGAALVMTTSFAYRAHKQRAAGFAEGLASHAPDMRTAAMLEAFDDRDQVYVQVRQALRRDPGIAAIYNTGGANRAVAAAIRDQGLAGRIVFVGHELTEWSTALLQEGVMTLTIDQAPELQARRAIDRMLAQLGLLEPAPYPTEIPFTLHTLENA